MLYKLNIDEIESSVKVVIKNPVDFELSPINS